MQTENHYIIEFHRVAESVKVTAVDPVTGVEACVVVPARGLTQNQMQELAIKRLQYVMKKGQGG